MGQSQLQQTTNFATYFLIFRKNKVDDSHKIAYFICYFWKSGKIWNCPLLQIVGGALRVNFFACWVNFQAFVFVCWLFSKSTFFQKILSKTLSECQMIWIQIVTEILIWVQPVYKGYQKKTKVTLSKERVNKIMHSLTPFIVGNFAFFSCRLLSFINLRIIWVSGKAQVSNSLKL